MPDFGTADSHGLATIDAMLETTRWPQRRTTMTKTDTQSNTQSTAKTGDKRSASKSRREGNEIVVLDSIEPRLVFPDEDADFTPWLKSHGLKGLGRALSMRLEPLGEQELIHGCFVDLVCQDRLSAIKVVIESQIAESSDMRHFGQSTAYGLLSVDVTEPIAVVWIVSRLKSSHRVAMTKLNSRTDSKFMLFCVEMDVVQVDDAIFNVHFNLVVRPDDWVPKQKPKVVPELVNPTPGDFKRGLFFHRLVTGWRFDNLPLVTGEPTKAGEIEIPCGDRVVIMAAYNAKLDTATVKFTVHGESKNALFTDLQADSERIEKEIGFKLNWNRKYLFASAKLDTTARKSAWNETCAEFREKIEALDHVLREMIEGVESPNGEAA